MFITWLWSFYVIGKTENHQALMKLFANGCWISLEQSYSNRKAAVYLPISCWMVYFACFASILACEIEKHCWRCVETSTLIWKFCGVQVRLYWNILVNGKIEWKNYCVMWVHYMIIEKMPVSFMQTGPFVVQSLMGSFEAATVLRKYIHMVDNKTAFCFKGCTRFLHATINIVMVDL